MGRDVEYFRRVGEEMDTRVAKALAQKREFFCEGLHILYTPYARCLRGAGTPSVRPEGLGTAMGIFRTHVEAW